ncbi:MAG: 4-alpha-glucanotransferase [Oscillospiraceae bacterium]|nr:4-alpha-glucanotransferase [Oscillospiraceae bacterium]
MLRESGILMHITSLPGSWGIGTFGKQAFAFVDFLYDAGQKNWQILPLTPTGYGDSPYQSCSAFAGNPYLIDLDTLVEKGLLTYKELTSLSWGDGEERVDFGCQYRNKAAVLRLAYDRFTGGEDFDQFCRENSSWLSDFSLFMALKEKYQGAPWYQWEHKLKFREPSAIWQARQELKDEIRFYSFVQYLFFTQWNALHSYAREKGVKIIGDVPIYVPYDSVDVWSNPELFQLDAQLNPEAVAGCPPDAFSEDGQLWGNPLYRWEQMAKDGYSWWLRRLEAAGNWYDVVRLDHFRGLEAYWSVPAKDTTAKNGKWIKGPGMDFIGAVQKKLPKLELIAEDLGFLTQEVLDLLKESGYPGMKVLGFAFDSREPSDYLPHNCCVNSVCYTGTHDNMTAGQWFDMASPDAVAYAREYMHITPEEGDVWGMIRTAFSTVSKLCIIPMQDYLGLGAEGRMNFPGTQTENNWTWRAKNGFIEPCLAEKIRALTVLYGRTGNKTKI